MFVELPFFFFFFLFVYLSSEAERKESEAWVDGRMSEDLLLFFVSKETMGTTHPFYLVRNKSLVKTRRSNFLLCRVRVMFVSYS